MTQPYAFRCNYKDCVGIITEQGQKVSINGHFPNVHVCPVCKCVYVDTSGRPLRNQAFQRVFYEGSTHKAKPLDSEEKRLLMEKLFTDAQSGDHGAVEDIAILRDLGHTDDCKVNLRGIHKCNCNTDRIAEMLARTMRPN